MQKVDHLGRPGKFHGIEEELIPILASLPGIPVLDDPIDGDLAGPIFRSYAQQLRAVLVMFLALPVAVGPSAIHRGGSRELPVSGDGSVDVVAQDEVVIEIIGHFGPEGGAFRRVTEDGLGIVVPEDSVAARRNEKRDGGLGIGLHEFDRATPVVHLAVLVLPEPVNPLVGTQLEGGAHGKGPRLVFDRHWNDRRPAFFAQDRSVPSIAKTNLPALAGNLQPDAF